MQETALDSLGVFGNHIGDGVQSERLVVFRSTIFNVFNHGYDVVKLHRRFSRPLSWHLRSKVKYS